MKNSFFQTITRALGNRGTIVAAAALGLLIFAVSFHFGGIGGPFIAIGVILLAWGFGRGLARLSDDPRLTWLLCASGLVLVELGVSCYPAIFAACLPVFKGLSIAACIWALWLTRHAKFWLGVFVIGLLAGIGLLLWFCFWQVMAIAGLFLLFSIAMNVALIRDMIRIEVTKEKRHQ